jgi:hypothetical protein
MQFEPPTSARCHMKGSPVTCDFGTERPLVGGLTFRGWIQVHSCDPEVANLRSP